MWVKKQTFGSADRMLWNVLGRPNGYLGDETSDRAPLGRPDA